MKQTLIAIFTGLAIAGTTVYAPIADAKAKHSKTAKHKAKTKTKTPSKK